MFLEAKYSFKKLIDWDKVIKNVRTLRLTWIDYFKDYFYCVTVLQFMTFHPDLIRRESLEIKIFYQITKQISMLYSWKNC